MEITVTIPPSVEEHLRTYAASLFYETSPYALSRAIISALVNELDSVRLIGRDEIVAGILETRKPDMPTHQPSPVTELQSLLIHKPNIDISMAALTDPLKLKIPKEQFNGDTSNVWLVWGWCVSSGLYANTQENGMRKSLKFRMQDVIHGLMKQKGMQIKDATVNSVLDVLVKRQWLTFIETNKRYTLSPIAQKWALMPQNQAYLTAKGFRKTPMESNLIAEG